MIVPTYNERDNIEIITDRLRTAVPDADLLVVDDGSPDGTGELADKLAADDEQIHVLHRTEQGRPGRRLRRRASAGRSSAATTSSSRWTPTAPTRPSSCPPCWRRCSTPTWCWAPAGSTGGEVVNWPLSRKLLSRGGNTYARLALGMPLHDATGGFRAYRRAVLEGIDVSTIVSQGYCFQVDLAWRAWRSGFRVVEVPITFVERVRGESKMSNAIVAEALWRVTAWGFSSIGSRGHRRTNPRSVLAGRSALT